MNGPSAMYKMKPIYSFNDEVELPNCMYKMKKILDSFHNCNVEEVPTPPITGNVSEQVKMILKSPLPEVAVLENRQEAILQQLAQLKVQMATLREELKTTDSGSMYQQRNNALKMDAEIGLQDIVINASPEFPPFFLVALASLWSGKQKIELSCHVHSTILQEPKINEFTELAKWNKILEKLPTLSIFLVWKYVGADTELVISPVNHSTVCGESNILRFFSRIGPSQYNYEIDENPCTQAKIDEVLDICYYIVKCRTKKEKLQHLRSISAELGKTGFLFGREKPSIADVALWSTLKQIECTTTKDLTSNFVAWFQRCTEFFIIGV